MAKKKNEIKDIAIGEAYSNNILPESGKTVTLVRIGLYKWAALDLNMLYADHQDTLDKPTMIMWLNEHYPFKLDRKC